MSDELRKDLIDEREEFIEEIDRLHREKAELVAKINQLPGFFAADKAIVLFDPYTWAVAKTMIENFLNDAGIWKEKP